MARTRARAKGRRGASGERFAKLPVEVLEHPACATLSGAAFRVLVIVAAGFNGMNNGALACTERWARRFGVAGTDTSRKALGEIERRGLLDKTRTGRKLRKAPTLYALTWQPLQFRDGQALAVAVPATWRFRNWRPAEVDPAPKGQTMASKTPGAGVSENKLDPDPKGTVTPLVGVISAGLTPKQAAEGPFKTPDSGDTLRSTEGGARGSHKPSAAHPDPPPLERRLAAASEMIRTVPGIRDGELASAAGLTLVQVGQLRDQEKKGQAPGGIA